MLMFIIWFIIVGLILAKAYQAGKREEARQVKKVKGYHPQRNVQPRTYQPRTYQPPQGNVQQRKVQLPKVQPIQPVRQKKNKVMQRDAVLMSIGMNTTEEVSEAMRQVNDLMIMGYQPQMTFERDFIGEGVSMLNRYETLQLDRKE